MIQEKFADMKLKIDAFSSLQYVGVRTSHPPTDYKPLKSILRKNVESFEAERTKPSRTFRGIYEELVMLNDKFSGDLLMEPHHFTRHELHFTCSKVCEACGVRCENTKDHIKDGIDHKSDSACQYQQILNNKIYYCKKCHLDGRERSAVIINKDCVEDSTWFGITKYMGGTHIQTLDCVACGEIYRSKWYGNRSPEETCVL